MFNFLVYKEVVNQNNNSFIYLGDFIRGRNLFVVLARTVFGLEKYFWATLIVQLFAVFWVSLYCIVHGLLSFAPFTHFVW